MRIALILILALTAVSCRSKRNNVSRTGADVEGNTPVAVHPNIDNRVRYVKHTEERLPDGRMAIKVVLSSRSRRDRALILTTQWMDADRVPIEVSDSRSMVIPSGGTIVYEDSSYTTRAERFNVSVRLATQRRKTRG